MGAKIEGLYRKDIYELPPDSIRELIINAVMNCSFLQSSHIQVAIYDDRLEITSPGGLMPGVTIERMKEGYSQIRNRALAHAFSYMNLIEGWGTGIPRLIQQMKEYGLREPEFIDMEVAMRINLYRASSTVSENVSERPDNALKVHENEKVRLKCTQSALKKDLNAQEKMVVHYIEESGKITSTQLATLLDVKKRRAQAILSKLTDEGVICKDGASRSTHYVLTDILDGE